MTSRDQKGPAMLNLAHAEWQKSRQSGLNGCVEVAFVADQVAVRDSKDRGGPVLVFDSHEWQAFVGGVRENSFIPVRQTR
jgi:hypothetical protein